MSDDKSGPDLIVIAGGKDRPTQAVKSRPGELPELTPKQAAFVRAMLSGAESASAAYRAAYNCDNMKPSTIHRRAFDVINNSKVKARLNAGFERQDAHALHSGASLRRDLIDRLYKMTVSADSDANRLRAMDLLGRTEYVGLYLDRAAVTNADAISADEVERQLSERLKKAFSE